MGRKYVASFIGASLASATDLFEINAPSDAAVKIHSFEITQRSSTTNDYATLLVHRGSTSGSGGNGITPAPLELSDNAFGGTIEAINTTQSTEGTILHAAGFSTLAGYLWTSPPEIQMVIPPGGRLILELASNLANGVTFNGVIHFEEIG